MACFHPLPAWRTKNGVTLAQPDFRETVEYLRLPCGSCLGCAKARALEWAVRCSLEVSVHDESCWCTLTYDEEQVPPTLERLHMSTFVRRLRRRLGTASVRFFGAGEYGERTWRPHYHVILFGAGRDRVADIIQDCWSFGFAKVDALSDGTVPYVAGYCSKKIGYKEERAERVDFRTGEVYTYQPPFVQMSRRPGIGAYARDKFWQSWRDHAVYQGRAVPVPRFLHNGWKSCVSEEEIELLKVERAERSVVDFARVEAREHIAISLSEINAQRRQTL